MSKIFNIQLKNIKIYQRKSLCGYADIYFKNKKIGEFSNDGFEMEESYYDLNDEFYENYLIDAFHKFYKDEYEDKTIVDFLEYLFLLSVCEKKFKINLKEGFKLTILLKMKEDEKSKYEIIRLNYINDEIQKDIYEKYLYEKIYIFDNLNKFKLNKIN